MNPAEAVLALLRGRGQTLAVAESLTGGLLSATIVDVPGASKAFRGGLVVYATDLKATLAGVPPELLAAHGNRMRKEQAAHYVLRTSRQIFMLG